jgi:hypothetical protein
MTKLGCEKYFLQGRILSTAGAASRFTKQTSEILFIAENSVFFASQRILVRCTMN